MSTPFNFGAAFQEEMLALMLQDQTFAAKCAKHIPVDRLYSEAHRYMFTAIKERVEKDGGVPGWPEMETRIRTGTDRAKAKMLRSFCKQIYGMKVTDPDYIKTGCTEYARKNAFVDIFQTAQTFWNAREHEKAYEYTLEGANNLYAISFADDANIPIEEFEKVRLRHIFNSLMGTTRIPTNIKELDIILRGGLEKGELGILLAEPKKGKSIGLLHMGATALMMRFGRVAHFVLEGTTEQSVLRYLSRLTLIPYSRLEKDELTDEEREKVAKVERKYMDRLELIPFNQHWSYTVLDIEQKIKEMERAGKKPDLVIVDYGDLVKGVGKYDSARHEQTEVYRDLKRLAVIHKLAMWTASQAKRPEEGPEVEYLLRSKDIAENFEKVRIADLVITLNQTPREKHLGILRIHVDIYRSQDAEKTIRSLCDYRRMIFHSKRYGSLDKLHPWMSKRGKK